jgi:hypothetical protein
MRKLSNAVMIALLYVALPSHDIQAQLSTGYTLTVKVYRTGTWSGNVGEWIGGATVTLTKSGFTSFQGQTQTTNANGIATFTNVPIGSGYLITVSKPGCGQNTRKFDMGRNNSTVNIALDCAARARAHALTVKVLNAKAAECGSGPQYVSGATVRLKQGAAILQTATSNNTGSATFQNVAAGNYTLSAIKNNCSPVEINYTMPGQDSETSISMPNCYTSLTYDLVAQLTSSPVNPKPGRDILLSLGISNNGPNGPSMSSTISLRRYTLQGDENFYSPQVLPNQLYKPVDQPKQLPGLCKGESTNFTFFDKAVPSGHYLYRLSFTSPINDANNDNHQAELTVHVLTNP